MPTIEWNDSYSVGIEEFDQHHKHLFDLLNKAYDACMYTSRTKSTREIIGELILYVLYHFAAEESYMKKSEYEGLTVHVEEHDRFRKKIDELKAELEQDEDINLINFIDLTDFLASWIQNHICEVDMKYSGITVC